MTEKLTAEELRARGVQPRPVVYVEGAYDRVWPDGVESEMRQAIDRVYDGAANQYAMLTAGAAAQLIREAFDEAAHRAVFERSESDDGGVNIDLLVVFDADGEVLWYDREDWELSFPPFGRKVDEIEAYGGQVIALLGEDTQKAIERLVEMAESTSKDGYLVRGELETGRFTDDGETDGGYATDDQLLELDVQEEIDNLHRICGDPAADGSQFPQRRLLSGLERDVVVRVLNDVLLAGELPKVRLFPGDRGMLANVAAVIDPRHDDDGEQDRGHNGYISLDVLPKVLRRETAILDPEDVPALMSTIRAAADTPAGQHQPQSTVPGSGSGDFNPVDALSCDEVRDLARRLFNLLEHGDAFGEGAPGEAEWDSDMTSAMADQFARYDITFTPSDS